MTIQAAEPAPTVTQIKSIQAAVTASTDLSDKVAAKLNGDLEAALSLLATLQARQADVQASQHEAANYTERSAKLQREILTLVDAPPIEFDASVSEARQQASAVQLELSVAQQREALSDARQQAFWLGERASTITAVITSLFGRSDQAQAVSTSDRSLPDLTVNPNGNALASQVADLVTRVSLHTTRETTRYLQQELTTLAPRQTLATLYARTQDLQLQRSENELERRWDALNKARIAVSTARLVKAHKVLDQASSAATNIAPDGLDAVSLSQSQLALLEQELPLLLRTSSVARSLLDIDDVRQVLTQINNAGAANDSLADELRELRKQLPDAEVLSDELHQLQQQKRSLLVDRLLWQGALSGAHLTDQPSVKTVSQVDFLSENDLALLVDLLNTANRVTDSMIELETALSEAQTLTNNATSTLAGRVLWLRTNQSAGLQWINNVYKGVLWISTPSSWSGTSAAMLGNSRAKLLLMIIPACLCVGLLLFRPRLNRLLRQAATKIGNVRQDSYWITPVMIGVSVLWALPLPLLIAALYWLISDVLIVQGSVVPALKLSMQSVGSVLMVLLFFKALAKPDGVFRRHFEWSDKAVDRLYRHLRWFVWVTAFSAAFFTMAMVSGLVYLRYGLGVVAFMVGSVAMSVLFHVCLRPDRGVAFEVSTLRTRSALIRLAIWMIIVLPLLIGFLPLVGYFDTAVEIQSRGFQTGVLLMLVVIVTGLAMRHFMVAHRRLSLNKARRKRAAREAERAAQEGAPVSGDATPDLSFAWDDDYRRIAGQAQRFFRMMGTVLFLVAAWFVWKPLFPALGVFDNIVLWQGALTADGTAVSQPVTLATLLLALTIVVLGVLSTRSLRVFLEVLIFERLKLDSGARYAIHAILSYTLIGASLLFGIAQLGVDWSKFQWIVAALGVGLGFGLQEIVANFICGLIILFERPVRVGDTVTIGNLSGTVSNIQIRATTLTDFDNLEVILPNKSIITENVTNWTRHDAVTRITLSIGVAYGSNIEQVRRLLMECLEITSDVLKNPAPTVFFVNHGDSSLNFELRAFVPTPAHRLPVADALHSAINTTLTAHGIDIPFPQRVVRLDSSSGSSPAFKSDV